MERSSGSGADGAAGYKTGRARLYPGPGSSTPLSPSEITNLSCPECSGILRDPRQLTTCGCRYCSACMAQRTTRRVSGGFCTCGVDGAKFQEKDVRRDRGCEREIESLEVDCPTEPDPCPWRGKLTTMEYHMSEECPRRKIECSNMCGLRYTADDVEDHMSRDCVMRPANCNYCTQALPLQEMKDHIASCELAPALCEYCKDTVETKSKLSEHLRVCAEYRVSCPCRGCSYKGKMTDVNNHIATAHIFNLAQEFFASRGELAAENTTLESKVSTLTDQMDRLLKLNETKEQELRELKVLVDKLSKREREREMEMRGDLVETDSSATRRLENSEREGELVEYRVRHMSESIIAIQGLVTEHGSQLDDIRLRQDIMEVRTTDGVLVWKIPDVRRRYREAVERKTISLYSPPFYTSQHGYKVGIRLYLNGDGVGKGTHVSLFFFIMRSEHDNLLNWPFKQAVRFTLLHQKNPSSNISDAFVPDPSNSSYQKPKSDMNVASGFPKFARQSVLQDEGFTQDNVIFVKCQVDLSGLRPL